MTSAARGGFRGFVERDRPFIDDQPDRKYGWEAPSRWGSLPGRAFGRACARGAARATSFSKSVWTGVRNAARNGSALFAELLLVGSGLAVLASCAEARAVVVSPIHIDQVRLGFGLNPEGRVSPGCAASTFSLRDPIHLSMHVSNAAAGSVVRVSIREVVSHRVAWSEDRPVPPGPSYVTFEIGRGLALGRYRAESTLGGEATTPWDFVVHARRPGVR